eukprot:m.215939 g.215939  ORF g.215939 m.215939 type:complete len:1044 (+) comp18647_c5_seq1:1202-4333(+)
MADVRKEGTLLKSPPGSGAWKKRYCVLKAASASGKPRLEYFVDYSHFERGQTKGVIDLSSCTSVERGETDPARAKYVFLLVTPMRRFGFQAASEEDCGAWITAISAECFGDVGQPAGREPPPQPAPYRAQPMPPPEALPPARPAPYSSGSTATNSAAAADEAHPWLFENVSRDDAERILKQNGAENGLFLVRPSSKRGSHALTVCWEGRIIHHLIACGAQGRYQLNGKPCHKCYSLAQVITYLRRPHVPPNPLVWKTCLTRFPDNVDGAAPVRPAALMTVAQEERVFKTVLCYSPEAHNLGFRTNAPCFLKASTQALTIVHDNTRAEVASWPLSQLRGYGCDGPAFLFHTLDTAPNPGTYRLETELAADIITIIRDHVKTPTQGPARAQSTRVAPTAGPNVAQFQSMRARPEATPMPLPRSVLSATTEEDASSDEEPAAQYAADWDNIDPAEKVKTVDLDRAWAEIDKANLDIQAMCEQLAAPGEEDGDGDDAAPPTPSRETKAVLDPPLPQRAPMAPPSSSGPAVPPPRPSKPMPDATSADGEAAPPPLPSRNEKPAPGTPAAAAVAPQPAPRKSADMTKVAEALDAAVEKAATETADAEADASTASTDATAQPGEELFVAACDYDPAGAQGKMALVEGDVIAVTVKSDKGWWFARKGDQQGWVPADFIDPFEADEPVSVTASTAASPTKEADGVTPVISKAAAAAAAVVASAASSSSSSPDKPSVKPKPLTPKPKIAPKKLAKPSPGEKPAVAAKKPPPTAEKPKPQGLKGEAWASASSAVANALADMSSLLPNPMGVPPGISKRLSRAEGMSHVEPSDMPKRISVMPGMPGAVPIPGLTGGSSSTDADADASDIKEESEKEIYTDMSDAYPVVGFGGKKSKTNYEEMVPVGLPSIEPMAQESYEFTSPKNVPVPTAAAEIESEYAAPKARPVSTPAAAPAPAPAPAPAGVKVREMSNALRIQVMNLVKDGTLTINQAVERVAQYESGAINDPLDPNAMAQLAAAAAAAAPQLPPARRTSTAEDAQIDQLLDGVENTLGKS